MLDRADELSIRVLKSDERVVLVAVVVTLLEALELVGEVVAEVLTVVVMVVTAVEDGDEGGTMGAVIVSDELLPISAVEIEALV